MPMGSAPIHLPVGATPSATPSPAPQPHYAPLPDVRGSAVRALYVHVPFCTTKCHYCDFYSLAGHLNQAADYWAALEREIALNTSQFGTVTPDTIFIGGGTPTLLEPEALGGLLETINSVIDTRRVTEFTIEANPNTFDLARARVAASHGINRISFGAQSFNRAELQTLQRDHDPDNVPRAVETARTVGIDNINIDLIFGIPGQTMATWDHSLRCALACQPQHLSCYSLIYESNTPMTARMKKGEFATIDETRELEMFNHVYDVLRAAGFERYEVSNYAHPGRRCRHNMHYWTGADYLAWGPSAAAHVAGHRWKNVPSLARYLDALAAANPQVPIIEIEHLPPARRAGELATLYLRLVDGLPYGQFQTQTGLDARQVLTNVLKKYEGMGFLESTTDRLALTEPAVAVSNTILADVLAAFG